MIKLINKFHIPKFIIYSIVAIIVIIQFSGCDQIEVHLSKTIIFEGKLYKIDQDEPFTGKVYNTYPNGQREYEGKYKNGKPNGSLVYWYESGNKMREGKLKNGSPVGRWKYFNQEGSLTKTIDH